MIMKNMKLSQDFNGSAVVSIELANKMDVRALQELQNVELLEVTVKKYRKKKTLSQVGYLWKLCDEIAIKLETEKELIYRLAIKHVGVFELIPIKREAVELFTKGWSEHGIGWICEELRESKLDGYITLQAYYGSSVYDSKQQSRLIDFIVEEAKELGIDTMTVSEIERLRV